MKYFAFVLTVVILTACSRQENSESTDTERAVAAVSVSAPALLQIISTPLSATSAVQPALEIQNAQVLTLSALTTPGALAISADGKIGAYINDHSEVIVWDALQLTLQESIMLPNMNPSAVAVSPNGDRLAIGYYGSSIVIWSRSNKKVLMTLSGYNGSTTALAFSRDGNILASGTSDHITRLWDLSSGKRLQEFVARDGGMVGSDSGNIVSLEFSGDGGLLLTQEFYRGQYEVGRGLTIWDTKAGYEVATKNVAPPNSDNNERSGMSVGGMGWMLAYTGHDGLIAERLDDCGSTSHQFGMGGYADTIVTDGLGRWVATIEGYSLNFLDISGKAEAQKITLPGKAIDVVAHPDGSSIFVLLTKQDSAGNISESGGMVYRIAVPAQMQTLPPMAAVANKVRCEPSEVARTEMKFRVPEKMPMLHEIARFSVLDIQSSQSKSATTVNKSDRPIYANGLFLTRDGLLKVLYERRGRPHEGAGAAVWSMDSHKLIQSRDTRELAYLLPLHEDWLARNREGNVLDILGGHVITNIKEGSG